MKNNALIINVARGGIINEDDLYDALNSKKIAGAAKRGAIYDSRAARAAALLFSYRTCKRSLEVF